MRLSENDPSSYSTPENEVITHVDLDWTVDFEKKVISGVAELNFQIIAKDIESILLDVDNPKIAEISCKTSAGLVPVSFNVDKHVPEIGSRLTVYLPTKTCGRLVLVINYETTPAAGGLQWLTKQQTSGKTHPYLFSQCQPIYARSMMPCQDTPSVKFTYTAKLRYDKNLVGLMSAINVKSSPGYSEFEQTVPIQSYLIAIAVGDLVSKDLSPICRVWAERNVIDAAAYEFSETPDFLAKAISLCGEYVWKRYDILVMPPSFPYGGMENPCLTFVTPTVIAGDRSMAAVVAHEIAHSWTGNLVTNRNFEHFWLNEGFTVFTETKIVGLIEGAKYRDFHCIRGLGDLTDCINTQLKDTPDLQKLVVDLTNLSPDDAFSSVPYYKGCFFLRYLEDVFGGPKVFEPFFRHYLEKYKFKSILTNDFKKTVWEYFSDPKYAEVHDKIDWDLWLHGVGMPPVLAKLDYSIADQAHKHAELWKTNNLEEIKPSPLLKECLSSLQTIEMLSKIKETDVALSEPVLSLLASTYKLESTNNAEILFYYLRLCISARLEKKMPEIFRFADSNFRMKFVRPIYKELGQWPEMKPIAISHFNQVRDQMMKMVAVLIAKDLGIYQP